MGIEIYICCKILFLFFGIFWYFFVFNQITNYEKKNIIEKIQLVKSQKFYFLFHFHFKSIKKKIYILINIIKTDDNDISNEKKNGN